MATNNELLYSSSSTSNSGSINGLVGSLSNSIQLKNNKLNEEIASSILYLTNSATSQSESHIIFMQNLVNHQEITSQLHQPNSASNLFSMTDYHKQLDQESEPSSPVSSLDTSPLSNSSGHISNVNSQLLSN